MVFIDYIAVYVSRPLHYSLALDLSILYFGYRSSS